MSRRERRKNKIKYFRLFFSKCYKFNTDDEYWDKQMYDFLYKKFMTLLCSDVNLDYSIIKLAQ